MTYYRAYIIGQDGHFKEAINLDCADDTTAVESAKQLVNGYTAPTPPGWPPRPGSPWRCRPRNALISLWT
jgi:hypothetical protein